MLTPMGILLLAPAAQAQGDVLAARLDHSTLTAVEALLDSASMAGLPTEPLTAKALEGAAKHAPGDRIVRAIRSLVTDLGRAREAFGGSATPSEIAAGATALRAGVDPSALKQLRGTRSDLTIPLGILTDLVINGVPADTAVTVIRALAARGAADADLAGLVRQVREDVSAGLPPGGAAMMRGSGPYGTPPRLPGRPGRASGVRVGARP
jgi:hypothetical protein